MEYILGLVVGYGVLLVIFYILSFFTGGRPFSVVAQAAGIAAVGGLIGSLLGLYGGLISFIFLVWALDRLGFGLFSSVLVAILINIAAVGVVLAVT